MVKCERVIRNSRLPFAFGRCMGRQTRGHHFGPREHIARLLSLTRVPWMDQRVVLSVCLQLGFIHRAGLLVCSGVCKGYCVGWTEVRSAAAL